MSRGGHLLAAIAVGSGTWALDPTSERALLAIGLIAGASLPDQIEGVIAWDESGHRFSLLPHRSISHWPPIWVAIIAAALFWLPAPIDTLIAGVAFGALLHLLIDLGSPMGVPWVFPTRKRSFGDRRPGRRPYVYRTGTLEEWRILAPIVAGCSLLVATHLDSDRVAAIALARSLAPHWY